MSKVFEQVRKRESIENKNGELIVACPTMKSNCNISMLVRSASCFGASKVIITGKNKVDSHIARDYDIDIEHRNSLLPILKKYKQNGYRVVGLEQATHSNNIFEYQFSTDPTVLVVGNECKGIEPKFLECLDDVIEIPLVGQPHSLNVAVATSVLLFEYAKQMNGQLNEAT